MDFFDFDGDGETSCTENYLAYGLYEATTNDETDEHWSSDDDYEFSLNLDPEDYDTREEYEDALEEEKYGWRNTCITEINPNVDPEDYETEEEYEEALKEDNYGLNEFSNEGTYFRLESPDDNCDARPNDCNTELYVDRNDYPNNRRYEAAFILAGENFINRNSRFHKKRVELARFIIENADTIIAANYLSEDGGFLYSTAVKENFQLPIEIPDSDEDEVSEISEFLYDIVEKDIPLAIEIWEWCLKEFLPYAQYDDNAHKDLTTNVLYGLYDSPDEFPIQLVRYMYDNPDFYTTVVKDAPGFSAEMAYLVVAAMDEELWEFALEIYKDGLEKAGYHTAGIVDMTQEIVGLTDHENGIEAKEFIVENFLPLLRRYDRKAIKREIPQWEKFLAESIYELKKDNEEDTDFLCNSRRNSVPDDEGDSSPSPKNYTRGGELKLPPEYSRGSKIINRNHQRNIASATATVVDNNGMTLIDFSFDGNVSQWLNSNNIGDYKKLYFEVESIPKSEVESAPQKKDKPHNDTKTYIYCGVTFKRSSRIYHYRTEDTSLKVGDKVMVPVGHNGDQTEAEIVTIGKYTKFTAPYPLEKTRVILGSAD